MVKIADVEFASMGVTPEHLLHSETPNWTAPEVLAGSAPVSPASDVYSLASVCFEVYNRQIPWDKCTSGAAISKLVRDGKRPDFATDAHGLEQSNPMSLENRSKSAFRHLVGRAWAQDQNARPSAVDLVREIGELKLSFEHGSVER